MIQHINRDDAPDKRLQKSMENDQIDLKYGFKRYKESTERIGWLINMHMVCRVDVV